MASSASTGAHLDATEAREVVYCHACSAEWYRDDAGLICPSCESEATEIISSDNDPRAIQTPASDSPSPPFQYGDDDESDPEEADIDDHLAQHGFLHGTSTRMGDTAQHHNPNADEAMDRFLEMIERFGGAPVRTANEGPIVRQTTFTSNSGSTARLTIFSTTHRRQMAPEQPPPPRRPRDAFQAMFDTIMRGAEGRELGAEDAQLARSLRGILDIFNPANGVAGDAVFTEEAFDSVISAMMDTQSQQSGAPPASEQSLLNLKRQAVTEDILSAEDKRECSICIEEMKVGDTAVILPCKHWFHDECVTMWLRAHNTCPVCRSSIEEPGEASTNAAAQSSADAGTSRVGPEQSTADPGIGMSTGYSPFASARQTGGYRADSSQAGPSRVSWRTSRAPASPFTYDTSSLQRRTSHSPSSPRDMAPGEHAARIRQRSPSAQNRPNSQDDDIAPQSQNTGGPLSWLRNRFYGSGGP